ncbi:unnamed protein product (macronuclear) [Paramecium tetraurelia]|uniref:Uncharacterized protein n=1 Tax=Paramecium tetraurelia TaxID=5888 RepID=A0DCC2_PARTE|nr:uncharacterized protein GSPATT00015567001 [Paramecium tetraurelia]CAK80689.1 unnamed protein product [Paramecium tetraurelia]|eukprot:XP_001448086.1 hypothetical protein (macronuclear) [Paramecium tetraurelia strain d4-2]
MQQHYSQQRIPQAFQQPQRNASNSPLQRVAPPQPFTPTQSQPRQKYEVETNNHYSRDLRVNNRQASNLPNGQSYEKMEQRIQTLEKENQNLKKQLENANNQIQILNQKVNQNPSQCLLKTTTFELVVLQKAVEQLEGLKNGLTKKKLLGSHNQTTLPESQKDSASEFKSKVTLAEDKISQPIQQSQAKLLFPKELNVQNQQSNPPNKEETKEETRLGRKVLGNTQSDQVDERPKTSPIKYLNVKASVNQISLRISPKAKSEISQN